MDSLTHSLTALALARLLPWRAADTVPAMRSLRHRLPATATLLVSANVADLDILFATAGTLSYLEQNRAASHSLLAAVVLGATVGVCAWRLARRRAGSTAPPALPQFLLLGGAGGLSHCLLDWLNPYGVQLLWPFRPTWYGLDWFSLIDPWVLMLLFLGLSLPLLFRLIAEEIGARRNEAGARWGAALALAAIGLLALGRATLHANALAELDARQYRNRAALRTGAFPSPLHPFRWNGVVETDATYEEIEVVLLGPERCLHGVASHYKPAPSPALEAGLRSRTAEVFLAWARFPSATLTPTLEGWQVRLRDLRYAREASRVRDFRASIDLGPDLAVRSETLTWGAAASD